MAVTAPDGTGTNTCTVFNEDNTLTATAPNGGNAICGGSSSMTSPTSSSSLVTIWEPGLMARVGNTYFIPGTLQVIGKLEQR